MAWGAYMLMAGLSTWLFLYFLADNGKRRNRDRIDLLKTFVEGALQVPLDTQPARGGQSQFQQLTHERTRAIIRG